MTSGQLDDDAARWREATALRGEHPQWVVIWLATVSRFRAYRRLPGARRDTALTDPTAAGLASQITRAEQAARSPAAPSDQAMNDP
ncbi:MAG TPA: hypothetical protein VH637_06860 [Streptosporangiaceae bacterium]